MKTLRKLACVLVLTLILGLTAFAGETQTPPCAPGETQTPPCQGLAPGNMSEPPISSPATAADATFTEIATEIMESMLSIF